MLDVEAEKVIEPPFDPLTDTGKVAKAVQMVREQIRLDLLQSEKRLEVRLESILVEREKAHRSFWRGVYNVCKSGIKQAFAEAEHLFKE